MKVNYLKQNYTCSINMTQEDFKNFKELNPNYKTIIRREGEEHFIKIKHIKFVKEKL